MLRIGVGTDTHRLVEGRELVLGGVKIVSDRGAEGHSDADALAHAIADAILGALCERSLHVVNVDSTILLEQPKLRTYVDAMRANIAGALGVETGCVSVKAKTGEGVDAVGQGLAVTAQAAVLMESN